jgi:hypothetical protein
LPSSAEKGKQFDLHAAGMLALDVARVEAKSPALPLFLLKNKLKTKDLLASFRKNEFPY